MSSLWFTIPIMTEQLANIAQYVLSVYLPRSYPYPYLARRKRSATRSKNSSRPRNLMIERSMLNERSECYRCFSHFTRLTPSTKSAEALLEPTPRLSMRERIQGHWESFVDDDVLFADCFLQDADCCPGSCAYGAKRTARTTAASDSPTTSTESTRWESFST